MLACLFGHTSSGTKRQWPIIMKEAGTKEYEATVKEGGGQNDVFDIEGVV